MKLIAVIDRKYIENEYKEIIIELNGKAYKHLKELGKLMGALTSTHGVIIV